MSMNKKLRECPFCATQDAAVVGETDWFYVSCFTCGADGGGADTKAGAEDNWNTRAGEKA
ncbi:hypothetical protein BJI49_09740 [Acetobacter pasteurianus]|nr:hypothetical protein BJI49_09740 [Acetobacter pasteurianus]GAB32150.1 hypothetical protein APS_2752 [Acetobacter pasteurianus subsp. pasteurianus LMG 1262 = NBRC 106471]GCD50133.1 hypothetical protein NBRC106471_1689 [Acetobacter pasteurianus subsp. pasteurianus LMG 1262 = NBRC 106471]